LLKSFGTTGLPPTATRRRGKEPTAGAIQTNNERAVANALEVATARYKDLGPDLIQGVLLPGIDWLEANGYAHWFGGLLIATARNHHSVTSLSSSEARLNLLVSRDSIETRLDYMVGAMALHTEVVIDFLGARVRRERELKADSEGSHRYEAIPFRFHGSNEALKKVPTTCSRRCAGGTKRQVLFSLRGASP